MKSIAIYGGAFSPVTVAHAMVAHSVARFTLSDEVWVVPSYHHALKGESAISYDDRVMLCRKEFMNYGDDDALCSVGSSPVIVKEIDKDACEAGADGSTRSVIEYLNDKYPDHHFRMVVGQDNVEEIDKWKHPEWLKLNVEFIVLSRGGLKQPDPNAWFMQPPHAFMEIDSPKLSSTMVRNAIEGGDWEFVRRSVSASVLTELKRMYQK